MSEKEKQTEKKIDKKKLPKKPTITGTKEFNDLINKGKIDINRNLFLKKFSFLRPCEMLNVVYSANNKKKNNDLINVIKSELSDLKNEIEEISEDEIQIKQPDKIVDIVERILEFNRQNQEGQGQKILTSSQMLSRLSIILAQLKAGNNSEKSL